MLHVNNCINVGHTETIEEGNCLCKSKKRTSDGGDGDGDGDGQLPFT